MMAMTDIYDIKPALPLDSGTGWVVVVGVALVLAGATLWRWRRQAPQRQRWWSMRRAVKRLETEAPGLDDREFAYRLTALLRRALAWRTGIPAPALTTEEILPLLDTIPLPPALQRTVAETLSRADPARYATPLGRGPGGMMPPGGKVQERQSLSWPPEASSSPRRSSSRQADLATVRAVLGRGRLPWSR
jgi:hypothetical protein